LRIAHAVALHALQAIPIVGYLFHWLGQRGAAIRPVAMTFAYAALHLALATWLFAQAMNGRPLIAID
jgi:hypothetical protein